MDDSREGTRFGGKAWLDAPMEGATSDKDTLKILVASDVHAGYAEKHPVRGNDSFEALEEVLQIAQKQSVDLVLLAGDLFHDNKPSRKALQKVMQILRDYCLGDKDIKFDVVSDSAETFHDKYKTVNFKDPNFNVQLPVFSIHGNHDDPAGDGGLAALDLLSTSNLVNYFGRAADTLSIKLNPVLITKGPTKLALYGLGHVRDERLHRMIEEHNMSVMRPHDSDSWFQIMAVHQNRQVRGAGDYMYRKGYIKESQLPNSMDLVVWGHEHECQIGSGMAGVEESAGNQFVVIQPGSTVATSLSPGEEKPKHVAIIQVCGTCWKMDAIPLKTVRPFVHRDVCLQEHEADADFNSEDELMDFLAATIDQMLFELETAREGNQCAVDSANSPEPPPKLPLIRLRVDYTGYSTCNPQKFGQRFVDRVANPAEILLFHRKAKKRTAASGVQSGHGADDENSMAPRLDASSQIQQMVGDFLRDGKEQMKLFSMMEMNHSLFVEYVGKETKSAIADCVTTTLERAKNVLAQKHCDDDDGDQRKEMEKKIDDILAVEALRVAVENDALPASHRSQNDSPREPSDALESSTLVEEIAGTGKSRGRARGAGARGRGRGRGPSLRQTRLDLSGMTDDTEATSRGTAKRTRAPRASAASAINRFKSDFVDAVVEDVDDEDDDFQQVDQDEEADDDDVGSAVVSSRRSVRSFASRRRMR